ncbi:MAG: SulP family inorganic anion transporter [Alsobacter sp.]
MQFDDQTGFRFDLVAGLTAAAVVLPKAMAYAAVAGLPVAVGLYTAFVPGIVYGLLGSSRVLSVSSTTTLAILTAAELGAVVPDGEPVALAAATAALTAMVGLLLILARALRLGFVANFISVPVLTGFKAGIGLVILLDQAPKLLGLHLEKVSFVRDLLVLVRHVGDLSLATFLVGATTLVALAVLERLRPHSAAPLAVVAAAIAASWLLGLPGHGVATVGHIPRGLPAITIPDPALLQVLAPAALGIALMSFTESIAAARAFAAPGDPAIQPNRELVATGLANLVGAFFGAMPAGGGTSQTGVVRAAGGQTQVASLVTAAAALAVMVVLAPVLGWLPQATLAAVVIVYSVPLIQPAEFLAILRARRMEFGWALAAALGVLAFGTLQGIVVAIVISFIGLAAHTAQPRVSVIGRKPGADVLRPLSPDHPEDETIPGLLVLRPEGRLFFVNVQTVADQIAGLVSSHRPKVLVLDLSRVPDIEYSALQMLRDESRKLEDDGTEVWLAGLNPGVLAVFRNAGLDVELGPRRLLFNARTAIRQFQQVQAGTTSDPDDPPQPTPPA